MTNKKSDSKRQNSRKSNQGRGNEMNYNGNYSCKSKSMDKNRKRKFQHQHFMNEDDYRLRLQEVLYSPEHILTKTFRKDGPPLGNEFDSLPSNDFLYKKKGPGVCHHTSVESSHVYKRRKVCSESNAPTLWHGMGKGLMTDLDASAKKNCRGKGLVSQKGAPVKKHGIGKGLMTVWQMTNPGARDFSSGVISGESLIQQKTKKWQTVLDLSRGFLPHASKNRKFLALLHTVEDQDFVLDFWQKSLNLLTWTEILRQVLVTAGFGSKLGMGPKGALNKEVNLMEKYGLNSGTLKGDLFSILLTQGSSGMKVSELAKSSPIVELNLVDTTHDLENLISSALSNDITLFEKISSSGYRLRINATTKEEEVCTSDCEDFGSIDAISEVSGECNDEDDSKCESMDSSPARLKQDHSRNTNSRLTVYNEIDESHPGEVWLLGLMEGEYSDLNVEEKLNALAALTDLLSAGSSIRTEDFLTPIPNAECPPSINHYASGGKIKRSTVKQCKPGLLVGAGRQMVSINDVSTSEQPVDSLNPMSKVVCKGKYANMRKDAKEMKAEEYLHPMQSIFLGSDRRYNRYWIFLGPCDEFDPGHKRIYFESSEDGHWEVIDTQEAFCTLLSTLDRWGAREACLLASLEKQKAFLCQATSSVPNDGRIRHLTIIDQSESNTFREDSSSPVSDVDNQLSLSEMQKDLPSSTVATVPEVGKKGEQKDQFNRSQSFGSCVWKSFYSELNAIKNGKRAYIDSLRRCEHCHDLYWRDEKHCKVCHTTFELDFDLEERYAVHSAVCLDSTNINKFHKQRILSSQLQALKAAVYAIETVLPDDAFSGPLKKSAHNLWVNRLRRSSNLAEFLQVLADFISAINEDWFHRLNDELHSKYLLDEIFANFTSMPQTSSAVALWLVKLDLLVAPYIGRVQSQNKP